MNNMYIPYAGIGSRETPPEICNLMTRYAEWFEGFGFTLRSGGADRADLAFEQGVKSLKEIYLPWKGFNGSDSTLYAFPNKDLEKKAEQIAEKFHPAWDRLGRGAKSLHTRNVAQVLGYQLNKPAKFILCYTKDGSGKGGTGQALRIAKALDIPIFDLGCPNLYYEENCLKSFISTLVPLDRRGEIA